MFFCLQLATVFISVSCCTNARSSALYFVISPQLSNCFFCFVRQLRRSHGSHRAFYSGSPGLKSRPAGRLYCLRSFMKFLSRCWQMLHCSSNLTTTASKLSSVDWLSCPSPLLDFRAWTLLCISRQALVFCFFINATNCVNFVFLWNFCQVPGTGPGPGPGLP
jgi:hypothetical protein